MTEKLGKKNIDIELSDDSNFIIFEVYTDEIVEDKMTRINVTESGGGEYA